MKKQTLFASILLAMSTSSLAFAQTSIPIADPIQEHCGWVNNDLPSELSFQDQERTWLISNMNYSAEGEMNLPDIPQGQSCLCMMAEVNWEAGIITNIVSAKSIPTKVCQQNKDLQ